MELPPRRGLKRRNIMKRTVIFYLGALLSFVLVAGAYAGQGQSASSDTGTQATSPAQPAPGPLISPGTAGKTATIEGEVLGIKGQYYTVKDGSGKTVQLHV